MNLEHTDFGPLFISLVRFSKTMLEQQGAFLPHGAIVSPDGKVGLVGAQPKEQQPGAQVTLQLLEGGLRGMAAKGICRAAGIAMDTRIKVAPRQEDVGRDAIWVILEEEVARLRPLSCPTGNLRVALRMAKPSRSLKNLASSGSQLDDLSRDTRIHRRAARPLRIAEFRFHR